MNASRSLAAWVAAAALFGSVTAAAAADSRVPVPAVTTAKAGTACVEPTAVMRRDHMEFLKHQRDDTVRGGVRGSKYSLKACIDCHASENTGSVASAPTDFCASCHAYAAVKLDCFECHSTRPAGKGHATAAGAKP